MGKANNKLVELIIGNELMIVDNNNKNRKAVHNHANNADTTVRLQEEQERPWQLTR
jgi:hypothetical protein